MKLLLDLQAAQTESRLRGVGRQTRSLAKALIARQGAADIHLLFNRRLSENLDELLEEFDPLVPAGNVHIFGVPGAVAERNPDNLWRTYAAEILRESVVAGLRPDIVHLGSMFEGFVDDAVTSIGRLDAPHATAVTLHDLIPLLDPDRYLAEQGPRRHWLRRAQFLKRADLLLSVSEYSRNEAMERLHVPGDRIAVISGGVDPAFTATPLSEAEETALRERYSLDKPFLFYVGAVDPRKNVELIIEAFARLPERMRDGHLIAFAGRLFDEEIGRLRIAAARYGVPVKSLRFCQHVPERDLVQLYATCEALVFPSTHEGFGLPALEAMACGAPTLVANATSLPEVVGNEALLFDPKSAEALAAKLEQVLGDPAFRAEARRWGLSRSATMTWDETARRAMDAFEDLHARRGEVTRTIMGFSRKPMLAFLSPLPSDRSGIADYSAELLPELARHYEVECIVSDDTTVTDPWILANFPIRDIGWFERNAATYDRIVYSFGNSHFHSHMLELVQRHPGVVLLHDFFLSDLIDWMCNASGQFPYDEFFRELYRTHGISGLLVERTEGRLVAVERFPCNSIAFRGASGIIVHSHYAVERARELYGDDTADQMIVIPHLRASVPERDRDAARARLGVGPDDYLVCSFGVMTQRKCSRDLFEAWIASTTGAARGAKLVFVGENAAGEYGTALQKAIKAAGDRVDVTVTGYASRERYLDYLAAADLAVQLRVQSRGETSGTVLDCLANGLPVIVNAHGSTAELPDETVLKLPDDFSIAQLAEAIDSFAHDPAVGRRMSDNGRRHIQVAHHPGAIGDAFHVAIEHFGRDSAAAREQVLLNALSEFNAPVGPHRDDFTRVANVAAQAKGRTGLRQILYDVTVLAESDARTGIQRVVRSIFRNLVEQPPAGYRIEPVRMDGHQFRYARVFAAQTLDIPAAVLPDDPVEYDKGDIYLSIDWVPDRLPLVETWLRDFGRAGGRTVIGVHDLLPLQLPQFFPEFMPTVTRAWFETALRTAHQFVCVSRTIADDVIKFGTALSDEPTRPIAVDFFHNAADLGGSIPSKGRPADAQVTLSALRTRNSFLLVGTVEPRKGHPQALAAFEQLWREGVDANLVLVGKKGWMMDAFEETVARHPENGKRLFWLQGISDEFLDEIYAACSALIAASAGEGFGLPLIEAALHKLPLIARDIPVFREVAGEHAFYFAGESGDALAAAIREWMEQNARGLVPQSTGIRFQTWRQSTDQLLAALFRQSHYGHIGQFAQVGGTKTN